jgi:hypothetical protein
MARIKYFRLSGWVLLLAILSSLIFINCLQFSSASFFDPDSYYHIAVSHFIKEHGPRYQFHWAQFSVLKDSFADKDFIFHLAIVPFFSLTADPMLAGKYAFAFFSILFVLAYAFILKRYLPDLLAALFLLLPFLSSLFTSYFLQLRSVTAANILTILGIYFLTTRRVRYLFFIALVYPLIHVSFFTLVILALLCESIRYAFTREFFARNIYAVLLGTAAGCLINPDFPRNLYALYLNGFMLPLKSMYSVNFDSGSEHIPFDTRRSFIVNGGVFIALNIIAWLALLGKRKMSVASAVWCAATNIYLLLAFFGNRYWYQVNLLVYIFLASYARDCAGEGGWRKNVRGIAIAGGIFFVGSVPLVAPNAAELRHFMEFFGARSSHLEDIGRWMDAHLPAGETIYHSSCADASYFICLNPKDNYLNVADSIYMSHRYPREFSLIEDLMLGRVIYPQAAIREVFGCRYGYVNSYETPLLRQLYNDHRNFKILYSNPEGVVFEISGQTP